MTALRNRSLVFSGRSRGGSVIRIGLGPWRAWLLALLSGPLLAGTSAAAAPFKVGIVAINAPESSNARFIEGATAAAVKLGWHVTVIDAAGSADRANAAFQNLVQSGAGAIVDSVFPVTSLGAGLAAARQAKVPVATWGGGVANGVAASDGGGGPQSIPVAERIVADLGGKGDVLELTYNTGQVCRERDRSFDEVLKKSPGIKITREEVNIPGFLQDGANYANAWLAAHPSGEKTPLAIYGCWDGPALGAVSAARQQGRDDVKIYGINGDAQALAAIKGGHMAATAWEDSYLEGKTLVESLGRVESSLAKGGTTKPIVQAIPVVMIDKTNVDKFVADHPYLSGR